MPKTTRSARWLEVGSCAVAALVAMGLLTRAAVDPFSGTAGAAAPISVPAEPVRLGPIQQTVSVSGTVQASSQVAVQPKSSGRVANVLVDVGARVKAGDLLVELENDQPTLQLQQAQANLVGAQAKLSQLQAGGRPDDVAQAQAALAQQQARLNSLRAGGRPEDVAQAQAALQAQQAKLSQLQAGGRDEAVAAAQAAVDAATARLSLVQKGATADVRQAAQSAVDADAASVAAAEAALANLSGSGAADLQQAQSQVQTLRSQVMALEEQVAATEAAQRNGGPNNAADVQAAQSAYDAALAQRDAARRALDLADNPLDVQVAAAQQAIAQAEATRDQAKAAESAINEGVPALTNGAACQHDANGDPLNRASCDAQSRAAGSSVRAAEQAVAVARAQLDLLHNGGNPATRASLQAALTAAEGQMKTAAYRLGIVQQSGWESQRAQLEGQRAQSQSQLSGAREGLKAAEARLTALTSGTLEAQRQAAQAQLVAAQEKQKSDQARLDQINGGPQDEDVQQARAALTQAQQQLAIAQQPATAQDIAAQQAAVDGARQAVAKASAPYTTYDIQQQEQAVAQAAAALRARQNPYTDGDLQVAQSAVQQAQAQADLAQLALNETRVLAPVDGIVQDRQVSPGALVGPTNPVVTLVPPAVEIAAPVDGPTLSRLSVGQAATVRIVGDTGAQGQTLPATVSALPPAVDPRAQTATVRLAPQDDAGVLRPGQLVQVTIVTLAKDGVLLVPRTAIVGPLSSGGQAQIVTLDGGQRVRRQTVGLGLITDQTVEITGGLSEGQLVVTGSTTALGEGEQVTPDAERRPTA